MLAESRLLSRNQEQQAASHYHHLDFLRATAVALVFFAHLVDSLSTSSGTGLGTAAHLGVLIFFVHTSLVLFMSLERMSPASRTARFYVRRVFRIYPLAVFTLLVIIWTRLPPYFDRLWTQPTKWDVAANLLLVQNLTGGRVLLATMWSLPFEVQMYIVLPLLFAMRKKVHSIALWAGSLLAVEVLLATHSPVGEVLRYFPCFIAGLVAYWLIKERRSVRLPFWVMPVALAMEGLALIFSAHFVGLSAVADSFAALGVGVLTGLMDGSVPPFLSKVSAVVAKYSYGLYLAHLPLMIWLFGPGHSLKRIALFAVLTVIAPLLLYHLIEQPMIIAGVALSGRIGQRTQP
jgi:peptidoglycan/LPS O-acetylase OafA/YrhL